MDLLSIAGKILAIVLYNDGVLSNKKFLVSDRFYEEIGPFHNDDASFFKRFFLGQHKINDL